MQMRNDMSTTEKNNSKATREKPASLFQVFKYCLPHMGIMAMIPITGVVFALILRAIGMSAISEFITSYIVIPLFIVMPTIPTVKVIGTLKKAFPRKTKDSHRIFLTVLLCSMLTTIVIEIFFNIGCLMYGFFPLEYKTAAFMRAMYAASPAAMNIFYTSAFLFYTFISMMIYAAYFIGYRSKLKIKFTLSCIFFLLFYVIFLILLLITYIGATFMNIIVLENIQIAGTIFNSSVLCLFVVFDMLSVLFLPILYFITLKFLNKKKKVI